MYWRRRVVALAGGLGVLGLLAWACSGAAGRAMGGGADPAATASPAGAQQAVSQAGDGGPDGEPRPAAAVAARPGAGRSNADWSTPRGGGVPARQARPAGCAVGDLVLSLFANGTSFGPGGRPQFQVDVVNVGSRGCAFDAGSRSLRLVIRSGSDRIWSSADCRHGPVPAPVRLARGVPYAVSFSWNRTRSGPGCRAPQVTPLPGTYTATAYDGGLASPTEVFTLG